MFFDKLVLMKLVGVTDEPWEPMQQLSLPWLENLRFLSSYQW